jgi:hypothetical protein
MPLYGHDFNVGDLVMLQDNTRFTNYGTGIIRHIDEEFIRIHFVNIDKTCSFNRNCFPTPCLIKVED